MNQSQRRAMIQVAPIAFLALPAWLIVGVVTAPFGSGLLMLMNSSPWILNLYPFLFAGSGNGFAQTYYIPNAIGLLLTVFQWGMIAWVAARLARRAEPERVPLYVAGIVLTFGLLAAVILTVSISTM